MDKKVALVIFSIVFPVQLSIGENLQTQPSISSNTQSDSIPYIASFWQDGNFEFQPGKQLPFRLENAFFSPILIVDTTQFVVLIGGENTSRSSSYWIVNGKPDKTIDITQLFFQPGQHNTMSTTTELKLDVNSNALYRLEIKLLPLHRTTLFRWVGDVKSGSFSGSPGKTEVSSLIRIDSNMPDFTVETLAGDSLRFSSLNNQIVVLNWWGTWCQPCLEEIPGLNKLVAKYRPHKIAFIAIAQDNKNDLSAFPKKRGVVNSNLILN